MNNNKSNNEKVKGTTKGSTVDEEEKTDYMKLFKQVAAGSLARSTSTTILVPVDTCKTRLQFQISMDASQVKKYRGFWHCLTSVIKEEGVLALYRGLVSFFFSFFFSSFLFFLLKNKKGRKKK